MEYVLDFVNMQRFQDPLLVHILEAMRTTGGQKISEEAWEALKATTIGSAGADERLKEARGWHECAYEWRIVSYAMHAHARLNANAAEKILYYIPAIDAPAARIPREAFDEMLAMPNIGTSAKFPGILPIFIGMEMILTESYLPPRIVRGTPSAGRGHRAASQGAAGAKPRQHRVARLRPSPLHAELHLRACPGLH